MRSVARSSPARRARLRDRREPAAHVLADRGGPSSGTPARRSAAISLTMARATRSRDARSPAGSYRVHEALAGLVDEVRPLAAKRLRQQEPRSASDVENRRMELHELEVGDAAPRPRTPSRCRRRSRRPGSSSRERPAPRRRSRSAFAAPSTDAALPSRPTKVAPVQPRRARATTAPAHPRTRSRSDARDTRCHSTRPISRPVASRAWSTRRTLCAASRPSAICP